MADHQSRPVVLCGRLEKVGSVVIAGLSPEYEGIYISTAHLSPSRLRDHHMHCAVSAVLETTLLMDSEVVHFITSVENGMANLPSIMSGSPPRSAESTLGSKNYSQPPEAIILGGGYDDEAVEKLRMAVAGTQGTRKVPWLRPDPAKTQAGPTPGSEEYAKSVAARVRDALAALDRDGRLDGNTEGIFFW